MSTAICYPYGRSKTRLAFYREDAQAHVPQGSGPAAAEDLHGSVSGSVSGGRDGH